MLSLTQGRAFASRMARRQVFPAVSVAISTTTTTSTACKLPLLVVSRSFASSSSVSTTEVDKFSGMDNDWWDPRTNALIPMNAIRVQYIRDAVQRFHTNHANDNNNNQQQQDCRRRRRLDGLQCLDIGCGGGLLSESLARLGATVTGIDPSQSLVQAAQAHAQLDPRTRSSIAYKGGVTAEDLVGDQQKQQQQFDVVCLLEVVEHATDVSSLLHAATELVKPDGGLLFVSTMSRTIKSHLLTIVGAEYLTGYVPVGTHNWHQYLSPSEIESYLSSSDVEVLDVSGMVLTRPPIRGNWDWKLDPNDTDVNWIGVYRKNANER